MGVIVDSLRQDDMYQVIDLGPGHRFDHGFDLKDHRQA